KIPPNSGLHLVPIPFSKSLADIYALGELTAKDYPSLIAEGDRVDTIAVPSVLAVYNWQKGSDRYRRLERFTQSLFAKWDQFQKPPFHPKWREINLAATVPGWTRSGMAEEALQKIAGADGAPQVQQDFEAFLAGANNKRGGPLNQAERN